MCGADAGTVLPTFTQDADLDVMSLGDAATDAQGDMDAAVEGPDVTGQVTDALAEGMDEYDVLTTPVDGQPDEASPLDAANDATQSCVAPPASDGYPRFEPYAQTPGAVFDRATGYAWWPIPVTASATQLAGDASVDWIAVCQQVWPGSYAPTVSMFESLVLPILSCHPAIDQSVFPAAVDGRYVVSGAANLFDEQQGLGGFGFDCLLYAPGNGPASARAYGDCPSTAPVVGVLCAQ